MENFSHSSDPEETIESPEKSQETSPPKSKNRKLKIFFIILGFLCFFLISLSLFSLYAFWKRPEVSIQPINFTEKESLIRIFSSKSLELKIDVKNRYIFPIILTQTQINCLVGNEGQLDISGKVDKIHVPAGTSQTISIPLNFALKSKDHAKDIEEFLDNRSELAKNASWKVKTRIFGFFPFWLSGKGLPF